MTRGNKAAASRPNPGEGKKARTRELLDGAAPLAAQVLIDIMADLTHQQRLAAANSVLNKTGFHDKSGVELAGPDGGPLQIQQIRQVIVDPKRSGE
jgi:hypothetical protein